MPPAGSRSRRWPGHRPRNDFAGPGRPAPGLFCWTLPPPWLPAGAARPAAQEEIDFAASLCVYPADTVIAVTRSQEDGAIRETFRMLRPREGASHAPAFEFLDLVGEEDAASEPLDLRALSREVG